MKKDLDVLLQTDMDRLSFLKHIAIGLGALTGIGSVIRAMSSISDQHKPSSAGYGSSAYGGTKVSRS